MVIVGSSAGQLKSLYVALQMELVIAHLFSVGQDRHVESFDVLDSPHNAEANSMSADPPLPGQPESRRNSACRWVEPLFFRIRTFDGTAWGIRLLVIFLLSQSIPKTDPPGNLVQSFGYAILLVVLYEATMFQRTVIITDHGIECVGVFAQAGERW